MADDADRAQALIESDLDRAMAAVLARPAAGAGTGVCVDCDEPIAAERLAVVPNAKRCLPCQALHEGP